MQLVVDLQIFSCQISSTSTKLLSKTKPSFKKKAWGSTATDPHLADLFKMQSSSYSVTRKNWWRWQESNLRPPECKSGALPTELHPQKMVAGTGFEPATFGLWAQRATGLLHPAISFWWWAWVDSNYRPHAYQACALTNWATGPASKRTSLKRKSALTLCL